MVRDISTSFQAESQEATRILSKWEPGTYRTLVVYVTHGTSGTRRYQIADNLELGPVQVRNKIPLLVAFNLTQSL